MLRFFVTAAERDLIYEKMQLIDTDNLSAYLRKMAIDGYIIETDHADIKSVAAEMQRIGVNINQIARRVNTSGYAYQGDIEQVQEEVLEIWRLLRLSLLKQR
jgi:hypothetical protein